MARVLLDNVSKVYAGGVTAVDGANIDIADKEFLVLVGPSGCGKSTTLRMIAGLEEISQGDIHIGETRVNDEAPKDRDIAMVFQNYALYPHMTVYKNMAFGLMLRKRPKKEIEERVREAARILGIEHLLDRKPKALSGGERQRVAVGRAIVRNPKVFLFDEPLSNLDAKLRVQMRAEISKLHTRLQATMIYVTHDQVEAMTMGDRIVVMLDGVIQQIAPPLELYNRPVNKFVAGFIGSPPMNFCPGTIQSRDGGLRFSDDTGAMDLPVDAAHHAALEPYVDRPVTFGIRPESFSLDASSGGAGFTADVEVVEPMGSEINLYLALGGQSITARVHSDAEPAVNAPLTLGVDMSKAHYFDTETELAIREES